MFETRRPLGTQAVGRTKTIHSIIVLMTIVGCSLAPSVPALGYSPQASATLGVGSASGNAGASVDLAVSLTPGSVGVSTLQFDLQLSSSLSHVSTTTGTAAAAAQKSASANVVSGGVRVLVFGLNANTIGAGSVAVVRLTIAGGAPAGAIPVAIINITSSDPNGNTVPTTGIDGVVTVLSSSGHTTPPVISAVASSGVTQTVAIISWITDEPADSQVDYGTTTAYGSSTSLNASMVISHSRGLEGLASGITYHYRVKSRDSAGNLATSGDFTFTTVDTGTPIISGVTSSNVTSSGATIAWTTNEASTSQVDYGTTTAYGRSTTLNSNMVTSHSQTVAGLAANTTYHFRVKSADSSGNLAISSDFTFKTAATGTGSLAISGITVSQVTPQHATVSWTTNVAANSRVAYGTTPDCSLSTSLYTSMVTSHALDLTDLQSSTTYYFRVYSESYGQFAASDLGSFQTPSFAELKLVYPRLETRTSDTTPAANGGSSDNSEYTGIAIANLSDVPAIVTFTAYDRTGEVISGASITNPIQRVIPPGAQLAIMDVELFGSGLPDKHAIGWIDIDSSIKQVTGFTLTFNASLSMMDGAPVTSTFLKQFVFPEIEDQGFTDLHVANPDTISANITFQLVQSNGMIRDSASRAVNALGVVAESLATLFPSSVPDGSDYVRVTSDGYVVPFELLGKVAQDVEGLNGLDVNSGAYRLYCPQYAVGGFYRSTLSIINLDSTDGMLTLRLVGDDGAQIGATKTLPILANGKAYISDQSFFTGAGDQTIQGYLEIVSSGPRIAGNVVFGDPARLTFTTALPLQATLQNSLVFSHVASDATYFMGLALMNPNSVAATATINLYKEDGSLDNTLIITIPARQRISKVLDQIFPRLVGQSRTSGYIRINADQGIAGYSVFGTRDLKTLSAVPAQVIK
ncbi:MAG: hypothetical protein LAP85_06505 [Acidobacteriia bacterium]|nr:hypothetical protein [Terriglobia bacterium]